MSPSAFSAHMDANKTRVRAGLSLVAAVAALAFVWNARTAAMDAGMSLESLVPVGFGLIVFFLFSGLGFKAWRNLRHAGAETIVRIDTNGVLDTRLAPTPIPWAAIQSAELMDLNRVHLDRMRDDEKPDRPQRLGVRLTVNEAGRSHPVDICPSELDTTAEAILTAVQAHLDARRD